MSLGTVSPGTVSHVTWYSVTWYCVTCYLVQYHLVLSPGTVSPGTVLHVTWYSVTWYCRVSLDTVSPAVYCQTQQVQVIILSPSPRAHLDSLLDYVATGVKEGARLVCGGRQVDRKGFFMEPTVLTDVEDHTFVAKEESFGPVMVVSTFENGYVCHLTTEHCGMWHYVTDIWTNDVTDVSPNRWCTCGLCPTEDESYRE